MLTVITLPFIAKKPIDIKTFITRIQKDPQYNLDFAKMFTDSTYQFYNSEGNLVNFYCDLC